MGERVDEQIDENELYEAGLPAELPDGLFKGEDFDAEIAAEIAAVDAEFSRQFTLICDDGSQEEQEVAEETILAPGTLIRGQMAGERTLALQGRVEGEVACPAVAVAAEAELYGRLTCSELELEGVLDGHASVEFFHLLPGGRQRGVTEAQRLRLEEGGRFDCLTPAPGWEQFVPELLPLEGSRSMEELMTAAEVSPAAFTRKLEETDEVERRPEVARQAARELPRHEPKPRAAEEPVRGELGVEERIEGAFSEAEDEMVEEIAEEVRTAPPANAEAELLDSNPFADFMDEPEAEEVSMEPRFVEEDELAEEESGEVVAEEPVSDVVEEPREEQEPVDLDFSQTPEGDGVSGDEYGERSEEKAYQQASILPLTTADGTPVPPLGMLVRQLYELLEAGKPLMRVSGRLDSGVPIPGARLLAGLPRRYQVVEMKHPEGSTRQLLATLFIKLGCGDTEALHLPTGRLVGTIRSELQRRHHLGRRVVLVVDEAERMYQAGMERLVQLLTFAFVEEGDVDLPEDAGCLQLILFSGEPLDRRLVRSVAEYFEMEWACSLFFSMDAEPGMPITNQPAPSAQGGRYGVR